jgi:hypothetical protein
VNLAGANIAGIKRDHLKPQDERAHLGTVDTFQQMKEGANDQADRAQSAERFAREEPLRRAREIEGLKLEIDQLPSGIAGPLNQQLARVLLDSKRRVYRKAIYEIRRVIAQSQRNTT